MAITEKIKAINQSIPSTVRLIAVSKYHTNEEILQAYHSGQRIFGESKAQEVVYKYNELPKDILWHFIGHLQSNKIKYIAPFITLIHSVDSPKLLRNINKEAQKINRIIPCLLQIHIAKEQTKYGFSIDECERFLNSDELASLKNIELHGVMAMATHTDDEEEIRGEFKQLKELFTHLKSKYFPNNYNFKEISMGMSNDYKIAIEEGSTLIRVGSKIFGERVY